MEQNLSWQDFVGDVPEYVIPESWTPEHVMHRMVCAMETLSRLPDRRPGAVKSGMPTHVYDWSDMLAWEELEVAEKESRKRSQVVIRVTASAHDMSLMDEALGWPGKYLMRFPEILLPRWALRRFRGRDGGGEPILGVVEQAEAVATGLERDLVAVR